MDCVGTILSYLKELVINYVMRHGAYVIQYKNKVQLLEQEKTRLREKMDRIQERVDRATINGEAFVTKDVSNWLKDAVAIANFLTPQENGESCVCIPGCMCPNLIWRYKTGKEADDKKEEAIKLKNRGDELEKSPLTCDAPFDFNLKFDSSEYYTTFQSRASVVEDIKNALNDSGVDIFGVHGPGGAGKTTMVKVIAKDAEKLEIFHKIAIAVVSKDPNTSKLQVDIATQLNLEYKEKSELERADGLRKALLNGKRKILIILDDLWKELDLNAIGIPISGLGVRGCKILLTSRDMDVFNMMNVGLRLSIGYLEKQETWTLFRKVTGESGVDELIAGKVSERCGGLPIAIVAVGAALRGKTEFEWKDALRRLEKCPLKHIEGIQSNVYTSLKFSYDFLREKDAKSCFLLCCLFPNDADISIDDLVKYSFALGFLGMVDTLEEARNRVQTMVNMLKWSCLLLNGKNENFVKMHDVIRDLAISITKEKQTEHVSDDWPWQQQFIVDHNIRRLPPNEAWKHHTAISLRCNDDNFTFSVLDCPQVHILMLELGNSDFEIPNDFFKGMKGARVLDLIGMSLELQPSSSVWELDNLRMLRLKCCDLLGDLSRIQNLKNLLILSIIASDELYALPREIGGLTSLQSLDLRNCMDLRVIPKGVISNLIHLEELYVTNSFMEWDTNINGGRMSNANIVELKSLTHLTILHVSMSTKSLRIMVRECHGLFEKLISFAIYINTNSNTLWDKSRNVLEISNIPRIDKKFHLLMNKVDVLMLSGTQERYLDGGESFCKLTDLHIHGCSRMKYLFSPSCTKVFQQLKKLHVSNCGGMEQIIGVGDRYNEEEVRTDEVIIFNQLRKIQLDELSQFRCFCPKMNRTINEGSSSNSAESIFNEKVSFPMLKILRINQLSVKNIWSKETIQSSYANEVSFSQLKEMYIDSCHNLVNVLPSNMLSRLQNLEILRVFNCLSLTLLVENLNFNIHPTDNFKFIDVIPKLRDLDFRKLPKLMKIWLNDEDYCSYDNSVHSCLKFISIWECGSLRHVFSAFVARHLAGIEELSVIGCSEMEVIVSEAKGGVTDDDIIKFSQLKSLKLSNLPHLKSFYQFKSEASHLFNHQVSFPLLRILSIHRLSVKNIWNKETIQSSYANEVSFSQLNEVDIELCHNLVNVSPPNMLSRLQNLEILSVFWCHSLTLLVEDLDSNIRPTDNFKFIAVFPKLRHLKLCDLPKLMKIWLNDEDYCSYDNSVHSCLKFISIHGCDSLRYVFSAFVVRHLASIEQLRVTTCSEMEVIVSETKEGVTDDDIIKFCQLKSLELYDLPHLKSFYQFKSEASHLFNHQVIFPNIQSLFLRDLNGSREIQLWNLLATTQEHLHDLSVIGCQVSTKVLSHHQKRSFRTINKLSLQNCQGFKHVIDLNGTIKKLLGDMKILNLNDLPELVPQWNKNLHEIGGFRNLKCIRIVKCPQLRSLFTQFMATTLQHLEMLSVRSCEMMEEIIIIEENNINFSREVKATRHIEFPQLRMVILVDLPNLKNFCNNESGSFRFSSLCKVTVKDCPKMKTFASGQIYLPSEKIKAWVRDQNSEITDGTEASKLQEFTDLNACIELRSKDSNQQDPTIYCGDTELYWSDWKEEEFEMMMIYDDADF